MFKTQELENQTIRALSNDERDAVTGGMIANSLTVKPTIAQPNTDWTFKDVFAKHGIGH
jgi:hypothetical protein